jgi:hypothetical protein
MDRALFRYTAKVSRQVLRFFKHCFLKPASPALYERELRPLLMAKPFMTPVSPRSMKTQVS